VQHQLANLKYCGEELRTFKQGWQQEALSSTILNLFPISYPLLNKAHHMQML